MCSPTQAARILKGFGMIEGLDREEVDRRCTRCLRTHDIGQRGLAYFLLDTRERNFYDDWGHADIFEYAQVRLDLSPRRTRELVGAGRKLRDLPLVDRAFCEQRIGWTKVLIILKVVSPEHQEAWIAQAETLNCKDLRNRVLHAREGEAPRDPKDLKGTPSIRYAAGSTVSPLVHRMLQDAQRKLGEERGRPATDAELLEVMAGIYLDMERDGKVNGWKHVPASKFRILLRPAYPGPDAPLLVQTEHGLVPIDDFDADDIIEKTRSACACCDGGAIDDDTCPTHGKHKHKHKINPTTEDRMRRRVLARDDHCCQCCGARGELHVHHITFRSHWGPSVMWNLTSLCIRCHALIHAELLFIEGKHQAKIRFVDREGRSVRTRSGPLDPSVLLQIEEPEMTAYRERQAAGEGEGSPASGATAPPKPTIFDTVPDVVDAAWWRAHAKLIKDRGDRGFELGEGTPAVLDDDAGALPAASVEPVPFDEAFKGIVGQDLRLERFRVECEGGLALDEPYPHTILAGPPGTGKTTIARALAATSGSRLVSVSGPTLKDVPALICQLASLAKGDMLFIDEIHAVPRPVLETLYEAMAEQRFSLTFRSGPRSKAVTFQLPPFTVLAATTELGDLPKPLLSRFELREVFDLYEEADLAALALVEAERKNFALDTKAAAGLAAMARGTPRELLRLLARAIRVAASRGQWTISRAVVDACLTHLGYDAEGLKPEEHRYLALLRGSLSPLPVKRLAEMLSMHLRTILDEIEPYLCRRGLLRVTPRGRVANPWPRPLGAAGAPCAEGI